MGEGLCEEERGGSVDVVGSGFSGGFSGGEGRRG